MKKILLLLLFLFAFSLPARAEIFVRVSPGARFYSDTTGLYADVAVGFNLNRLFWLSFEGIYDHAEIPAYWGVFKKDGFMLGVNLSLQIPLWSRLFLIPQVALGAGSVYRDASFLGYSPLVPSFFLKPAFEVSVLLHPSFSLGAVGGYYASMDLSRFSTLTPYVALTLTFHFGQGCKK